MEISFIMLYPQQKQSEVFLVLVSGFMQLLFKAVPSNIHSELPLLAKACSVMWGIY